MDLVMVPASEMKRPLCTERSDENVQPTVETDLALRMRGVDLSSPAKERLCERRGHEVRELLLKRRGTKAVKVAKARRSMAKGLTKERADAMGMLPATTYQPKKR